MQRMKALASSLLLGVLLVGCENTSSKLSQGSGGGESGDLESRVKKLEADNARYHDELEWLHGLYQQQAQKEQAEQANEPDPNATFAIDIAPDLKLGQVEGPPTACVTLVEAWDFA
jgi:hypothetical protein